MKKKVVLGTLKQRFIAILGVCMLLSLVLVIFVSYLSMRAVEKTKLESAMIADLKEMTNDIDNDYYSLLQISQQMHASGTIGKKFGDYLEADDQYDRIKAYKEFTENINLVNFGSRDVLLTAYFTEKGDSARERVKYSNFTVRKTFQMENLSRVSAHNGLVLNGLHGSENGIVDKSVVSILRPTVFGNGETLYIYVEAYSDVLDSMENRSALQKTSYAFLQVDDQGNICFSNTEAYGVGTKWKLPTDPSPVFQKGYVSVSMKSEFGFTNVLLMPEKDYRREMNQWMISIAVVVLIALMVMVVTVTLLIWLIYRPIKALEQEIDRAGEGDLSLTEYREGIREFDQLFRQFNQMKVQIGTLMDEVRDQDAKRFQLELDKLYYQINPHFLMNTLNTAHWMAVQKNQTEIDQFINQLNYILGYSLGKNERTATLRTELQSLKTYLELQNIRYDFQYHLRVEEGDYLDYPSARLILQPIAENAVCHNMDEFGNLWVSVRPLANGFVEIVMRDDGEGFVLSPQAGDTEPTESRKNKGIGLSYVEMTLRAFYGEKASIQIESETTVGTTVTILLPLAE